MSGTSNVNQLANKLLRALPDSEYQRLVPYLELVSLAPGQVIHNSFEPILDVYFPEQGLISLVLLLVRGSNTEVALVGNEGMIGISAFLGGKISISQAITQVETTAWKLPATVLKSEFYQSQALRKVLLLYTQAFLTYISQIAICNSQHTTEKRFARCLLSIQDRLKIDGFALTQKLIASMLGVNRSSVAIAASTLQQAGIIQSRRGKITIIDREALESVACECYHSITSEFSRLLDIK
ncbi:Crp/Fnr family transcriptional regulator [Oscillatoria salina]|uniref:Crp/Fnr family transcriptional regulator n=1 Tax=Oscillatoria salina TaxID=331517 RepID=UPI0013BE7FF2|nr:Crp/Fnr family transcriptional regulator [Oscillatoria salina]MBZ8180344.1 Crp/Fnr family transcriptional regulator [Oscillatoria salina IIICB1]NET88624.1 Crp/Fnr family transcriptional regulator [Kamptonema sp. SIO1D9]